ncbi:MAG: hypothetical protein KAT75_10535 [Dehalococcoidia bacterium]|nr:hypothetical protein [Dehalococcoidia bacterium]
MDIEERVKALEDEFPAEKEGLKHILLDIRTFFMAVRTPLRRDSNMGQSPVQISSEKRVEQDGNREES